jgi:para-aminobenzoate synthetase component 1
VERRSPTKTLPNWTGHIKLMSAPHILFRDDTTSQVMLFADPSDIIVAHTRAEVFAGLARMEAARASGKWLAGYMAYEAGHVFEDKLAPFAAENRETPLLCFGIFDAPQPDSHPLAQPAQRLENEEFLNAPKAAWDFDTYSDRFDRLHQHLRQGDCYQANLTMPIEARWSGDPRAAFWSLISRQPVKYGALVDLGGPDHPVALARTVLPHRRGRLDRDASDEGHRPARQFDPPRTPQIIAAMRNDIKTQAENRMIVDLLRNDISRITRSARSTSRNSSTSRPTRPSTRWSATCRPSCCQA